MHCTRMEHQLHMPSSTMQTSGVVSSTTVNALPTAPTRAHVDTQAPYHGHAVSKNVTPQLQESSTLASRPASISLPSHALGRSAPQNEIKQCSSPNFARSQALSHSVMSNHPLISPSRFLSGSHGFYQLQAAPMFNVIAGSPGSPAQHLQHVMSTPSPRPSILRKRGDTFGTPGATAKRRLPFMHEASSSPSNSAQLATHCNPGPPSQTVLLNAECNNGNTEESPRKRMRKQQFETDTIPDQIKMAIDVVQPVAVNSEMWTFSDHSRLMESFAMMGVTEKRKRGRPRTSSRPATVLPVEMHQSVSVFVDIDSPEEGQTMSSAIEQKPFRGSASSVPPVHLDETKYDLPSAQKPMFSIDIDR
ncbi:hypothetical protein GCK32_004243 [Trichostrongylus colubriformis]|uniref:Uncharacterized protein n=1 Tax=Trichostrongylus colubriformis TaxID=6319 RepID=A0AAN8FL41_TRICO